MAMPRLAMRPCELFGLLLLGLLPTHGYVQTLDPSALVPSAMAFAPIRPPTQATSHVAAGSGLCRRQSVICAARPTDGLRGLRAAVEGANANRKHGAAAESTHSALPRKKILVTGGAGYIGSHICADLLLQDFEVVVFDSFINSSPKALERAMELGGRSLTVYEGDVRDLAALRHVFESELTISSVVHLAGLKAVGESVAKPTMYYDFKYGSIALPPAPPRLPAALGCMYVAVQPRTHPIQLLTD